LADGTQFYGSLHRQAAILLYGLTKAHACIDGNKRIGATLMILFIELNGFKAFFPERELLAMSLMAAESRPDDRPRVVDQLADWIEVRIQRAAAPKTR
jgi:death-on-curing protein